MGKGLDGSFEEEEECDEDEEEREELRLEDEDEDDAKVKGTVRASVVSVRRFCTIMFMRG